MAAGISFGHFNIVGGDVAEDGPYVAVLEDRMPAESVTDLYVVLEPVASGGEGVCPELLQVIDSQFGRPQYSITGNVLQCLRTMQDHLRAWNKARAASNQASIGATCLAICGDEGYLAHAGPGLSYIRHAGHLRRMAALEAEAQQPLGASVACSPSFTRLDLSQGDTLLLVSSRFGVFSDDSMTDLILSLPPAEALPEIFRLSRDEPDFSALYLSVSGTLQPSRTSAYQAERSANGRDQNRGRGRRSDPTETADYSMGTARYRSVAAAGPAASGSKPFASRFRDLDRLNDRHTLTVPRPAVFTLAAVLLLSVAGWFGFPRLLQTGKHDRFSSLMSHAQKLEADAGTTTDPAQKRALLESANADIREARSLAPSDPKLVSTAAGVGRALADLDQARQLPSVTQIGDLANSPIAARSVTALVATTRVFLLDSSTGRVFAFASGDKPDSPVLVFDPGKSVDGVQAGKATQLAVRPAGSGGTPLLYLLDANKRLFSLDDSGALRIVGLTVTANWKNATAMALGPNTLFILDSSGNQVWQYEGSATGFTAEPSPILGKVDLQDASQLSYAGDLYVTTLNGKLMRISTKGKVSDVKINGIDHALVSPQPPVADAPNALHFIADPGNQRIVVTDAEDMYQYQLTGVALHGLRRVALDPNKGILYALSEQKIVATSIR